MGKTTNKLEQLVPGVRPASEHQELLQELYNYHIEIINQLFPDAHQDIYTAFNSLFANSISSLEIFNPSKNSGS